MSRIFSGMQPSGVPHLGNYLGMIKPLVNTQKQNHEILFSIVDLHSITVFQNPKELKENSLHLAVALIASGFDYKKHTLFIQSQVAEHTELAWILSCVARIGWLNRMTQFKDKAGKNRESVSAGLYFYPVLMAADILLYQTDMVIVGEDQKQHIEFARDVAIKFNNDYNTNYFTIPEPVIKERARIMSLKDGTKKMSKSDPAESSKILITDSDEEITSKIMKAKTDSGNMPTTLEELQSRPELFNLFNIYAHAGDTSIMQVINEFQALNFSEMKQKIALTIVNLINPVRLRYNEIIKDKNMLEGILQDGVEKAKSIAKKTIIDVKNIIGLLQS